MPDFRAKRWFITIDHMFIKQCLVRNQPKNVARGERERVEEELRATGSTTTWKQVINDLEQLANIVHCIDPSTWPFLKPEYRNPEQYYTSRNGYFGRHLDSHDTQDCSGCREFVETVPKKAPKTRTGSTAGTSKTTSTKTQGTQGHVYQAQTSAAPKATTAKSKAGATTSSSTKTAQAPAARRALPGRTAKDQALEQLRTSAAGQSSTQSGKSAKAKGADQGQGSGSSYAGSSDDDSESSASS
ncbi:hypothetical protein GGF32_003855 [Allomyces javanicus]|nr:hypothetical protein GGF32_003855 [Allomyces javanicus]